MLIAHRGGSGHFQENSLAAFEYAIQSGCDGAELDVYLTADGELVVHHNGQLDHRYTQAPDGRWLTAKEQTPIGELTLAQLQGYRIGRANPATDYARTFPEMRAVDDLRIPTLAQVIERVQGLSSTFKLVIEIKSACRFDPEGRCWQPVVDAAIAEIERLGFAKQAIFCGFDWRALRYAKERRPDIPIWMTTDPFAWRDGERAAPTDLPVGKTTRDALRAADEAGACWYDGFRPASAADAPRAVQAAGGNLWFPYYTDCSEEAVARARELGVGVGAWTVNLRERTKRRQLAASGIDVVCVDYFYTGEQADPAAAGFGRQGASLDGW